MAIDVFPTLRELGRPDVIAKAIWSTEKGMVLVSGGVRAGITTTLTAAAHDLKRVGYNPIQLCDDERNAICGIDSITVDEPDDGLAKYLLGDTRPAVVVFHETYNPVILSLATKLAKAGSLVVGALHGRSHEEMLKKFRDSMPSDATGAVVKFSVFQEFDTPYASMTQEGAAIYKACSEAREFCRQEGFAKYPMDSGHRFELSYHVKKD